jgi:hypothetical protein
VQSSWQHLLQNRIFTSNIQEGFALIELIEKIYYKKLNKITMADNNTQWLIK